MMEHLIIEVGGIVGNEDDKQLFAKYVLEPDRFFEESKQSYTAKQIADLWTISERYSHLNKWKSYKTKFMTKIKEELLELLSQAVEYNETAEKKCVRQLSDSAINDKNVISVFESTLTRTLGLQQDQLTADIMVVKVFYFDVIQDLILNGFEYQGEKYMFFTASAGQIRTKKTVFIKESLWNKYERTLMCGLTVDEINRQGGINVNKYLAYLALSNSATDHWEDFDIDRCIVVPDFETEVFGEVDFIDDVTYEVTRQEMGFNIEHTDGCGMILPSVSKKNFMIRLPWVKGLLASFDFRRFIEERNCSPIIKDIYGVEHDIVAEDIEIIFTKSQFKMWKYYSDWNQYKQHFKEYDCQAGTCKVEEDYIRPANINYQMLQTLTDITNEEIMDIAMPAIDKLDKLSTHVGTMLEAFGAVKGRPNMTGFQKSLLIYPEMLNDTYCKTKLNEIKNSMIKKYHHGKLPVKGKYTFVIPDLFAACQYWFEGNKNPDGLLDDKQVSCRLYKRAEKLDCLRPPHLYREHAVRNNVFNDDIEKWFDTDAIYTSCKDMISRILQFDNDGDTLLVVADKTIIKVAERNMEGIVPLYYEMKKAPAMTLSKRKYYEGMTAAWKSGTIGTTSNNVTKIWNNESIGEEELLTIKLQCMEGNYAIDSAKTLYMPTRPPHVDELFKKYTNTKMPYFFREAKDYTEKQVVPVNNSFVNKLRRIIKKRQLSFKRFDTFSFKKLMNDPAWEYIDPTVAKKYDELSTAYHYKLNSEDGANNLTYLIQDIRNQILESSRYDEIETVDMLIKYLYEKGSDAKAVLWACFGDVIYNNLKNQISTRETYCKKCGKRFIPKNSNHQYCGSCFIEKIKKPDERIIKCIDCGKEFLVPKSVRRKSRCDECQYEKNKAYEREKKRKQRAKLTCPHI